MRVCILLCVLWPKLAGRLPVVVSAADPEYFSDEYGNQADGQSNIVFANFSGTAEYHAHAKGSMVDGGLLPFYNFARSISSTTFGPGYPYNLVIFLSKGNFKAALGSLPIRFQVCLALGISLLVFFLLVGFFVPCCLCFCGCCHRGDGKAPSVLCVLIWGVIALVFICFLAGTGIGAAFQTSKHISQTLPSVVDTLRYTPQDIVTFINFSTEQILFIFVKVNFTVKVIERDLDNVSLIVSQEVFNITGLNAVTKSLREIPGITSDSSATVERLSERGDSLVDTMKSLQQLLARAQSPPNSSPPNLTVAKPDLSESRTKMNGIERRNVTGLLNESLKQVDSIPDQIQRATKPYIDDLKDGIKVQLKVLDKFKNVIKDLRDKVVDMIPLDKTRDNLQKVKDTAQNFDQTRSSLMGGLLWLDVVAMLLMVVGVLMVMFFYSIRSRLIDMGQEPKTPFCNTVCGGRLIYAGIGIFMMLGSIWLLLTNLLFVLGAPLDAIICTVIQDPNFDILDQLVEKHNVLGDHPDGPWLATTVLNNSKVSITLGSVFRDCRANKTLFNATMLEQHPSINLSRIFSQGDVNLSTINSFDPPEASSLLSTDLSTLLRDLPNAINSVPFDKFTTFNRTVENRKKEGKDYFDQLPESSKTNIRAEVNEKLKNIDTLQKEIGSDIQRLKDNLKKLDTRTKTAEAVQENLATTIKSATTKATKAFVKRLTNVVKMRNDEIKKNIYQDYSKCRPLYDIVMNVLDRGLCDNVANVLNGSWLAMYWFHIFMLISVEVAIHLHRLIPRPSLSRQAWLQQQQQQQQQSESTQDSVAAYMPPPLPPDLGYDGGETAEEVEGEQPGDEDSFADDEEASEQEPSFLAKSTRSNSNHLQDRYL